MTPRRPEAKAHREIDDALAASGWAVQDYDEMNLSAGRGVAVRELVMASGHGFADYLLFVDGRPVGALEAKPVGHTNGLDPEPRSRRIFAVHRPETLAEWLRADTLRAWTESSTGSGRVVPFMVQVAWEGHDVTERKSSPG
jgi:type I restriction enzyme, R subunit